MPKERLIYADDFLDLFYVASAGQDKAFISAVEMVMKDTPTIDAVEVVRCRDCDFSRPVYQENGSVFEGPLHCFNGRGYQMNTFGREYSVISPNNFCASGRRKMDAEGMNNGSNRE